MIRGTSPPHGGGGTERGWHGAEGCLRIGPQPIGIGVGWGLGEGVKAQLQSRMVP